MRASVPGKRGRRGTGRPGLGAGHQTRPARPFVRLSGAARHGALLRTRRRRPGAGRAVGGSRGGAGARPSAAETRRRAGFRLRVSPREMFASGAVTGVRSPLLGGRENSNPGRGEPEAGPPPASPRTHPGPRGGNPGPGSSPFPGTQPGSFQNNPVPPAWVARALRGAARNWFDAAGFRESGEGEQSLRVAWVTPLREGARRVVRGSWQ